MVINETIYDKRMKKTYIRLKAGERIPQTYILEEADHKVAWNCSFVSFYYEEGQGIKIEVYAEDKEKIDNLIDHFITPLLCTLPEYYYYGSMWAGSFEGLMNGVYKEVGSFIVQK